MKQAMSSVRPIKGRDCCCGLDSASQVVVCPSALQCSPYQLPLSASICLPAQLLCWLHPSEGLAALHSYKASIHPVQMLDVFSEVLACCVISSMYVIHCPAPSNKRALTRMRKSEDEELAKLASQALQEQNAFLCLLQKPCHQCVLDAEFCGRNLQSKAAGSMLNLT